MAIFHMSLNEFYDYTPKEINYALEAHTEQVKERSIESWEQTRLQIYYAYLLTPSSKSKISYNSFKREYLPFAFDKDKVENIQVIDDDAIQIMQNFFNKKES